jgi:hypothetical protein
MNACDPESSGIAAETAPELDGFADCQLCGLTVTVPPNNERPDRRPIPFEKSVR